MQKPVHQKMIESAYWTSLGVSILGTGLDTFANATNLITLRFAVFATLACIIIFLILLLFQKKSIAWITKDKDSITIQELQKKIFLPILGMLIVLWLPQLISSQDKSANPGSAQLRKPVFDPKDKRFKILVLPFDKEAGFEGEMCDVGSIICKRLETLNSNDTLNLTTCYLEDGSDFTNFKSSDYESLLKYHRADQIIWGTYALEQCGMNDSNKVCFNYLTDTSKWKLPERPGNTDYEMISIPGIDAIRRGAGQEDIDQVIYWIAGISNFKAARFQKTIKYFERIKNYENKAALLNQLAISYSLLGKFSQARDLFQKSLAIDTTNASTWSHIGFHAALHRNFNDAKTAFQKSLEIERTNQTLLNLAIINIYVKEYKTALGLVKESLQINTDNAKLHAILARLYIETGENQQAIHSYERYLALVPKDINAMANLAVAYERANDRTCAKYWFDQVLHIDPGSVAVLNNLGVIYKNERNFPKAIECYSKVLLINPRDNLAMCNLGNAYRGLGQYHTAKEYYESALQINPKEPNTHFCLGRLYVDLKEFEKCKAHFDKAISLNPNNVAYWLDLGNAYASLKSDQHNAIKCYKTAAKINPLDEMAWNNIGVSYQALQKQEESIVYFQKALQLNPKDESAWINLGYSYFNLNQNKKTYHKDNYKKSISYISKALQINPSNKRANMDVASIYSIERNRDSCIWYLKRIFLLDPKFKSRLRTHETFEWLKTDPEFIRITH
jgi:tetratricopeptide (TPR) repeat protein